MKIVALIPIKLNSQRLPHKNILPLQGKPLCYHITDTLLQIEEIDDVYVYCSDKKIKEYIPPKAKILERDPYLDGDTVKGFEIYKSFIEKIDADIYILAHTTSPFTKVSSVKEGLNRVLNSGNDSAFSAKKIQTFAWYQNKPINYDISDVPRTQDIEPIYVETSAFFIFKKEIFTKFHRRIGFHPYLVEVDDVEAIDIDTKSDYEFAKLIGEK